MNTFYTLNKVCSYCDKDTAVLWAPSTLLPDLVICKNCLCEVGVELMKAEELFPNEETAR